MKATRLAKKIRKWFAGDRTKNKPLEYRFTGKESRLFCHNFMYIVESLKTDEDQNVHTFKLHVFVYTGLNLRDSVSLFSRILMSSEQVQSLSQVCSNYFRATALFFKEYPYFLDNWPCSASSCPATPGNIRFGLGNKHNGGKGGKACYSCQIYQQCPV